MKSVSEGAKSNSMSALLMQAEHGSASVNAINSRFTPELVNRAECIERLIRKTGDRYVLTAAGAKKLKDGDF